MKLRKSTKHSTIGLSIDRKRKKWVIWGIIAALGSIIVGVIAACIIWYQAQLQPVDPDSDRYIAVNIQSGMTPDAIGDLLEEKGVIRSDVAFDVYTRFTSSQHRLQAGSYKLSPAESTPQIVDHLVSGRVEQVKITFYPGATLVSPAHIEESKRTDVTTSLKKLGFSDEEISAALDRQYDHPVFENKPDHMDIEGYVYGETYHFNADVTAEEVLIRTFDELYAVIEKENLKELYAKQGLNLYEGITLASIIQREAVGGDETRIAQVFLSRLSIDMPLGADVTYQYIADKMGIPRDLNLDSAYNTRRFKGLTPGPIAAPGLAALKAVAHPADTDYLYFVSGDDNVTYFSKTFEEHERNVVQHCKVKCQAI